MANQNPPPTGTVRLHNWRDFTKVMKIMSSREWIFRGHKSKEYRLRSGLDRYIEDIVTAREKRGHKTDKVSFASTLPRAEHFAIANFRAKAQEFSEWDSNVSALLAMQHYGAKTRLLDFTTSIFVALFFAYEERMTGMPRVIYAVNYRTLIERGGWKRRYLEWAEDLRYRGDEEVLWEIESQIENYYFQKFMFEQAEDVINQKKEVGRGIIPLYKARFNKRQMAQSGIELMPCTFEGFTKNLAAVLGVQDEDQIDNPADAGICHVSHLPNVDKALPTSLIKFVFDPEMEDDAWRMLDQANINASTIYPDLDGVAKSTRYDDRILGI